jgi:hypothetical protein
MAIEKLYFKMNQMNFLSPHPTIVFLYFPFLLDKIAAASFHTWFVTVCHFAGN